MFGDAASVCLCLSEKYLVLCPEPVTSVYSHTLSLHPLGSLTPKIRAKLAESKVLFLDLLIPSSSCSKVPIRT